MSDIIQLLPDAIANQIAAGEVVQRPASVVKELLENSIDAGSTIIHLIINDAGKVLIQVVDDGKGMSETDARMSFERHATSKISTSEDLFKIKSLGFRGEALASIAAVAKVELKSKMHDRDLGTQIIVEASEVKSQEHIAHPAGTSIAVKNLFYNVPARRNFLKSNAVEMRHIFDEFQRVALAYPKIAFRLTQNNNQIQNLPTGKLSQRIVNLFGAKYQQQMIACQEETEWLKVKGYIGKPEFAKKTRGEQFFFINNRFIKSSYLNHAVSGAFQDVLRDEQHPFYCLYIEMDPVHIDINVHPTKTEVKFDDERSVYGIIRSAVKQALGQHHVTPSLDFDLDVNFKNMAVDNSHFNLPSQKEGRYGSFQTIDRQQGNSARWETLYENAVDESILTPDQIRQEEYAGIDEQLITVESQASQQLSISNTDLRENSHSQLLLIHGKYILKQMKTGLMILDASLAHERILYEQYLEQSQNNKRSSQRSLFPVNLELNASDFVLALELKKEIEALGFEFEEFGKNNLKISGIPAGIGNADEKELFEELIEQFKMNKSELALDNKENMIRSIAKRAAKRSKIKNNQIELTSLIDRLFGCQQPNYSPNGSPTFVILGLEKIGEYFNQ